MDEEITKIWARIKDIEADNKILKDSLLNLAHTTNQLVPLVDDPEAQDEIRNEIKEILIETSGVGR